MRAVSQGAVRFRAGLLLVGLSVLPVVGSTDWPQYRGPDASGAAAAAPGALGGPGGTGLAVAWKRALGSGYSSVIVADGRVLTMFTDGGKDLLAAFDAASGEQVWRYEVGPGTAGHDGSHDGPLSTPLVAGGLVVGLSSGGRLFAVKAATGEPVWSVDLVQAFEASPPFYGFAGSPIAVDDLVVLQVPAKGAAVVGFDLRTGERRWAAGDDPVEYQTPAVVRIDGRPLVVAAGMKNVYGIEPRDGKVVWQFEHGGGGSGYGAGSLTPVAAGENRLLLTHKDDGAKVVALARRDALVVPETLWENRNIRHSYAKPVYHDGNVYAFSSRFLTCVDAATGEARWRSRDPGDGFLMLAGDHLVIVTKEGSVHVAAASPKGYREVAGVTVFADHAWAAPAFAGGGIFARSLGEIARIDVVAGRTSAGAGPAADAVLAGTRFGRFLEALGVAQDKAALIDSFLAGAGSFPLVEGDDLVHFLYRGPAQDVAVGGDLTEVGRERRMARVEGTDLFHYSTRLEPDARLNYVLLVDYAQVLDPRNSRTTRTTVLSDDLELSLGGEPMEMSWFAMPRWREPDYLTQPAGPRGRIDSREMDSKVLATKVPLAVYLPAGYDAGERRYPVAFVHDGPGARQDGDWPTALDNLIGQRIEPLIAVFIGPAPALGPEYTQMFATELVPFIDREYRTAAAADRRANVGAGFHAIAAFFCTFADPSLVGKLAAQSAFLSEFAWDPLRAMIRPARETPVTLYLDWGRYDLRNSHENWNLGRRSHEVVEFLRGKGYAPAGGEVNDGSGWASWRNRTGALLESLFPLGSGG
jgi:outer membrane protein assembly factor BamB/enterochelin esterase-like enzyme